MTIITVRANDTATAMDEIVEKLGTEAYILDTKKENNIIISGVGLINSTFSLLSCSLNFCEIAAIM